MVVTWGTDERLDSNDHRNMNQLVVCGFYHHFYVFCRDTLGASALFLYRKVETPSTKNILVEAAPFNASDEVMEAWLKNYLEALDQADGNKADEPGDHPLFTNSVNFLLEFASSIKTESYRPCLPCGVNLLGLKLMDLHLMLSEKELKRNPWRDWTFKIL